MVRPVRSLVAGQNVLIISKILATALTETGSALDAGMEEIFRSFSK